MTICTAEVTEDGLAVFTSAKEGAVAAVTVADDGSEVTAGPVGGVPEAVAVFVTEPASTSACVTAYVPVHEVDCPGSSVVTGQEITGGAPVPENAISVANTPVNVVFPVLVTR